MFLVVRSSCPGAPYYGKCPSPKLRMNIIDSTNSWQIPKADFIYVNKGTLPLTLVLSLKGRGDKDDAAGMARNDVRGSAIAPRKPFAI
jgi:hypothetical protein